MLTVMVYYAKLETKTTNYETNCILLKLYMKL